MKSNKWNDKSQPSKSANVLQPETNIIELTFKKQTRKYQNTKPQKLQTPHYLICLYPLFKLNKQRQCSGPQRQQQDCTRSNDYISMQCRHSSHLSICALFAQHIKISIKLTVNITTSKRHHLLASLLAQERFSTLLTIVHKPHNKPHRNRRFLHDGSLLSDSTA